MTRTFFTVVGLLGAVGIASVAADQARKTSAPAPSTLEVSGMVCSACVARLEKTVKKIDGVKAAKAHLDKGIAEITFDPKKIDLATIAKILADQTSFKVVVPEKK